VVTGVASAILADGPDQSVLAGRPASGFHCYYCQNERLGWSIVSAILYLTDNIVARRVGRISIDHLAA
jgi:hypothetical protein